MIKEWLDSYKPGNEQDAKDALREIMQEIALAGLYRAGFFEKAAFWRYSIKDILWLGQVFGGPGLLTP